MSAPSTRSPRAAKPLVRRFSYLVSLVLVAGLIGSATSCAQIIGVNKDYKKGSFPPKGLWYCDNAQYDEIGNGADPSNAYCDCACGAYDPDCDEDFDGELSGTSDHTNVADEPNGKEGACNFCIELDPDDDPEERGSQCVTARP